VATPRQHQHPASGEQHERRGLGDGSDLDVVEGDLLAETDLSVLEVAVRCGYTETQRLSEADLRQAGYSPGAALTPARAALLEDVRRVEARLAGGAVVPMAVTGPRTWEAVLPIPPDARGVLTVEVFVADLAANVRRQTLDVPLVAAAAEAAMPVGSEAVR